jgi:hypothetical protein
VLFRSRTMKSQPISLHIAFATVVLPTPAPPANRRLGICFEGL